MNGIKKRRWLWMLLFVWLALLITLLATGWNVVLVRDYHHFFELAKTLSSPPEITPHTAHLFYRMALGTLGFAAALATIILIFIKLLSEMHLNQAQADFLATVSHELKTPIAALELTSSLIRIGGLSAAETEALWASHQAELKRLREEVSTLLQTAYLEARPVSRTRNTISLESWINESMGRWQRILGPHSDIVREGDTLAFPTDLDLKTLNLITDNLVDNARKFARGTPRVRLETKKIPQPFFFQKPKWQIRFHDQGWGFNPVDSKKIFSRFYRVKTDAPYAIPGTGLGLYLANSASRALGVSLKAESPGKGRGAVFTLEGRVFPNAESL